MNEHSESNTPLLQAIPPERLEQIKGLLSGAQDASHPEDLLSSLLKDPNLASKLPQVMELVKPMLAASSQPAQTKPLSREEERDRLLLALRPFLSKERQDLMESILKFSKLGELLKQLS